MLQAQSKEAGMDLGCYTKVDCKVLNFMKEAIESGKGAECENKGAIAEATKCQLVAYGLSKNQAELAWKVFPYTSQCVPEVETEFKTCTVGCTKQKDRDACLEDCALPPKVKSEECLDKLAGKSTSNASKNAKCMMGCDKNSYSEVFDCQYNCHKDVLDALAGKDGDGKDSDKLDEDSDKSTSGSSKSSSSGSQTKPTGSSQSQPGSSGQSSAYLTTQVSSLAK
ncbi:hypothetical protein CONCODRAFT_14210, partial [Conidiobolus coronatus NRRL 28638]